MQTGIPRLRLVDALSGANVVRDPGVIEAELHVTRRAHFPRMVFLVASLALYVASIVLSSGHLPPLER